VGVSNLRTPFANTCGLLQDQSCFLHAETGVQNADRGIDKGLKANFCRLLADANEQSMIVIRSKTNVGSKNGDIEQDVAAD
jgi:hypothetical protein